MKEENTFLKTLSIGLEKISTYLAKQPEQLNAETAFELYDTFGFPIDLTQLICEYRLWNEDLEISISTRENEKFRNNIIPIGTTSMSAGSKTNPGGYVVDPQSLEQFEISDDRSVEEIAALIKQNGYEAVWKDWDRSFISSLEGGLRRVAKQNLSQTIDFIVFSYRIKVVRILLGFRCNFLLIKRFKFSIKNLIAILTI